MPTFDTGSFSSAFDAGLPAPVVGVDVPDHATLAVNRLAQQFKDKPNVVALLRALVAPTQDIEGALWQLNNLRSLPTPFSPFSAAGNELDIIGKIVGQSRNGLSNSDYLRFISARIATNRSGGTTEQLVAIVKLVLGSLYVSPVEIDTEPTCTARVRVFSGAITDSVASILFAFMQQAAAAGVRIMVEWIDVPPSQAFRFDAGGLGFDQGHFAGSLG